MGHQELTMDFNIADAGITTTTFADRGRVGADLFHNLPNEGNDVNSRRSSNFDYSNEPPSALLHTEEIFNDDYRPSRLASQGR